MHVLIKSSLLDSVLVVVNTIMFDGVILGDACLIVMSSTRRLQAITGNAGFPSSPHGCLDCDRPQDAETVKLAVRPFLVLIYRQLPLGSLYPPLSCSGLVTMVFFAVDINVIVVFSPYRGSTVVAAASSATLTVVTPSPTETAPTYWQSIPPLFVFDIHTVLLWTLTDNCLS